MTLLLLYVALALGVSFLCSLMEAVLLSVTPAFLQERAQRGHNSAQVLQALKSDIGRPLAAILSLNTIAHTVGAAGAGAQAIKVFGDGYVGVISAVLTLLILFVSEIVPKTLGAVYWRRLTVVVTPLLRMTIWGMYPLVLLSRLVTRLLARSPDTATVSRAEIAALAELGIAEGVFHAREAHYLKNVLAFRALHVADVMTPRVVMVTLPVSTTLSQALQFYSEDIPFSRVPVHREDKDDIVGVVHRHDVMAAIAAGRSGETLDAVMHSLLTVPETLGLQKLFDMLRERSQHMALVVDEYGGVAGLVTMEDIIETLLGIDITDEADTIKDMRAFAREQWRKRARRMGLQENEAVQPRQKPED